MCSNDILEQKLVISHQSRRSEHLGERDEKQGQGLMQMDKSRRHLLCTSSTRLLAPLRRMIVPAQAQSCRMAFRGRYAFIGEQSIAALLNRFVSVDKDPYLFACPRTYHSIAAHPSERPYGKLPASRIRASERWYWYRAGRGSITRVR